MASTPLLDLETVNSDLRESTLRLKNALTISELSSVDGFTFEVDPTEEVTAGELEMLETGDEAGRHYMRDYIGDTNRKGQALLDCVTDDEKAGDFTETLTQMTDMITDGTLKKLIIRPGTAPAVVPSDGKVVYHYVAYAEGKEGHIDSSLTRGIPYSLTFDLGDCIEGLYVALRSMRVGEIAKFWIHYDLAYRALGIPPRIPAKANILCIVEVVNAVEKEALEDVMQMSADARRDLPFDKIMACAKEMKAGGNDRYENKDYYGAIGRYRKGIDLLDNYPVALMAQEEERSQLLGTLCSNLAQCYLMTKEGGKACTAAKRGLRIQKYSHRHKLFFKFAKAKELLGEYTDCVELCRKALSSLNCNQKGEKEEIQEYMNEVKEYKKIQDAELKDLYAKMLGKGN